MTSMSISPRPRYAKLPTPLNTWGDRFATLGLALMVGAVGIYLLSDGGRLADLTLGAGLATVILGVAVPSVWGVLLETLAPKRVSHLVEQYAAVAQVAPPAPARPTPPAPTMAPTPEPQRPKSNLHQALLMADAIHGRYDQQTHRVPGQELTRVLPMGRSPVPAAPVAPVAPLPGARVVAQSSVCIGVAQITDFPLDVQSWIHLETMSEPLDLAPTPHARGVTPDRYYLRSDGERVDVRQADAILDDLFS